MTLTELKAICLAANGDDWIEQVHPANPKWARVKGLMKGRTPVSEGGNEYMTPETAHYIMTFRPANMLPLLEELETLREERQNLLRDRQERIDDYANRLAELDRKLP